jgi:predicted nucleic acid-binding protein
VIFADTGAFIARYVRQDAHHRKARRAWGEIERGHIRCFTSSFVLDETFTFLGRRTSYPFAAERARALLHSAALTILRPDAEDEERAVELFDKFADQEVSFTMGSSAPSHSIATSRAPASTSCRGVEDHPFEDRALGWRRLDRLER